ncbi:MULTISPECIES: DNA polymerase III subunit theta [Pectobacteriaceae]|uniref:DNA polymerase III subunit theta n=1 Tax=unclassified Brenneria TaxID=2634434 RepID=UPI001CC77ACC|nr:MULTISPECIES: DNA polymerase III subunit theta [Pectobacteriaceae]MEE3644405.1 DNA polymerase III subunit theta [Brenneria sp. L3_3C_1]MEE3651967.1 DNA polymerase III subunit theta [Brenneria sp. HEZEL_4_2_4]MEE3663687.1 DNA polymerase III subunit theta [Brenneria sp. g21c3]MDX5628625.1 DNA polymerase III subunit theta [Brenneria sp. L3-3Z]MDX5695764.1 DNA polymerase III subunit theta [Brenneria sp. L4-2C]
MSISGDLSAEARDKINVDLAASGVAYKERLNLPVIPALVEAEQPEQYRANLRERLLHYREISKTLPKGTDLAYQKMAETNNKT